MKLPASGMRQGKLERRGAKMKSIFVISKVTNVSKAEGTTEITRR